MDSSNSMTVNESEEDIELDVSEEKDVVDTVEDLMMMQNKTILKRNLTTIVRENKKLIKRNKLLEERLKKNSPTTDPSLSFHIDTEGIEDVQEQSNSEITYSAVNHSTGMVLGSVEAPSPAAEEKSNSRSSCWNCGGSHNLSDCKEPKDFKRISQNRKEFQAQSAALNNARYHEETGQKFGHLQPGLPSEKLMTALGVGPDQLPPYIYKLRTLGYPPGWLRHAQISQSGMSLYHNKGEVVENNDHVEENMYDINKLVSWPGFNTDIPEGCVDETNRFRVPPLHRCLSLKEMKRNLKGKEQKGYKKGKMQDLSTEQCNESREDGELVDTSKDEEDSTENVIKPAEKIITTPIKQKIGSGTIAETEIGTPIVETYSPFSRLPEYNKFGVNMTEHIVFDNLPNATGNWDKMTQLLKNIRNNKEDPDDSVILIEDE